MKKILCVILSMMFIVLTFAGCFSSKSSTSTTTTTTTTTESTTKAISTDFEENATFEINDIKFSVGDQLSKFEELGFSLYKEQITPDLETKSIYVLTDNDYEDGTRISFDDVIINSDFKYIYTPFGRTEINLGNTYGECTIKTLMYTDSYDEYSRPYTIKYGGLLTITVPSENELIEEENKGNLNSYYDKIGWSISNIEQTLEEAGIEKVDIDLNANDVEKLAYETVKVGQYTIIADSEDDDDGGLYIHPTENSYYIVGYYKYDSDKLVTAIVAFDKELASSGIKY